MPRAERHGIGGDVMKSEPTLTLVKTGGVHESERDALRDFWDCKDFIVIGPADHQRWGRRIMAKQIADKTARILYVEDTPPVNVDRFCTVELPEDNTHRLGGCGNMICANCRDDTTTPTTTLSIDDLTAMLAVIRKTSRGGDAAPPWFAEILRDFIAVLGDHATFYRDCEKHSTAATQGAETPQTNPPVDELEGHRRARARGAAGEEIPF